MLATVHSCATTGLDGVVVDVEVDISNGLPSHTVVGLPDTAVQEARERTRSAIRNSGAIFPDRRLTINLAPADIRKEGPVYDLSMAVGILAASGQLEEFNDGRAVFLGELSLDGGVRHTHGVLPMVAAARDAGVDKAFVPAVDGAEAAVVEGIAVYPVESLQQLIAHYMGLVRIEPLPVTEMSTQAAGYPVDFADVRGHEHAKRALEVAAAGAHNVLMVGPPGSGKTLLARALPSVLPPMTLDEAIEVTKVYSIAGQLRDGRGLVVERPFRAPHHTVTYAGMVGGGTSPRPGEISLAHRGVLFLDEFPEFGRQTLESLRQPLEDGHITITRAAYSVDLPARLMLVAAMNPSPSGFAESDGEETGMSAEAARRYRNRISGPLLDRIDVHIDVPRLEYAKMADETEREPSAYVQGRIAQARKIQEERLAPHGLYSNAELTARLISRICVLQPDAERLLRNAHDRLALSGRGHHRVLKLARTIADLAASETIRIEHLAEALQYRPMLDES